MFWQVMKEHSVGGNWLINVIEYFYTTKAPARACSIIRHLNCFKLLSEFAKVSILLFIFLEQNQDFALGTSLTLLQSEGRTKRLTYQHGRRSVGDGGDAPPPHFSAWWGPHRKCPPPTFLLEKWKIPCVLSPSNLHSLSACVIDTGVYK